MILDRMNRRVSLRLRLIISIAAVLLTVGFTTVVLTTIKESRAYHEDAHNNIKTTMSVLAKEIEKEVIIGDFATIEEILRTRARQKNIDSVSWQEEGRPALVGRNDNNLVARPDWFAALVGIYHPEASQELMVGGVSYGRIRISFSSVPMENRLWQSALLTIWLLLTMLVLTTFFIAVILYGGLAPLAHLAEAAQRIAGGDFTGRVTEPPGGAPEIGLALRAFNQMADSIEALLTSLADQRRAIDNAAMVTETDLDGIITYANEKFCSLTGYRAEELLGRSHSIINAEEHPPEFFAELWQTIMDGKAWTGEIAIRSRQGKLHWMATAITPVLDSEGKPVKFVAIRFDVTELIMAKRNLRRSHDKLERKVTERTQELEKANRHLAILSGTDGLTCIANRRHFDEVLTSEWLRVTRGGQPITLLMLDVDLFKNYNDHYGHLAGDDCLRKIAVTLQDSSRRASDLAARYGGEEFALIATDTDEANALQLAELVRAAIEKLALPHAGSPLKRVTVSIGVAVMIPENNQQSELLIHQADNALYHAKNQGRNRVEIYGRADGKTPR